METSAAPEPVPAPRPTARVSIFARPKPVPAPAQVHRRHGVTVRLDEPRYRRLTVVSTRYGRTYQDILARALDVYMTALGIEDPGETNKQGMRKSP